MTALAQAIRNLSAGGRRIEVPFRGLKDRVNLRTGQLAVLAGAPGAGKSHFAVNWAWRADYPVVYWAQDDAPTTIINLASLATGHLTSDIMLDTEEDRRYWAGRIADTGKRQELIPVSGARNLDELEHRLVAYREWLMESPPLVLADNLYNIRVEGTNYMQNDFYAEVLPRALELCKQYDTCSVLLHHVRRGDASRGTEPIKQDDVLFAGDKEASHVWGVYRDETNRHLTFQVVKQRQGKQGFQERFDWQPEKAAIYSR